MTSMQAHEIKSQFSEALDKVENGEEILISHHGKIVAHLSPWKAREQKTTNHLKAIEAMQQFERIKLPKGKTIENLRRTGQH